MLGIDTIQPQVTGKYAAQMRAAAVRVHTKNFNADDRKIQERSQRILSEYEIVER